MRILFLTSRYMPHAGGVEKVVRELALQMQKSGNDVCIVTHRYPRTLPKHEVIDGISVTRYYFLYPRWGLLKARRIDLFLASCVLFPVTLIELGLFIARFKPDVVNYHYVGAPTLFVYLLSLLFRIRPVVSLHGGDVDGEPFKSRFAMWLLQATLQQATSVTACSHNLLDQIRAIEPNVDSKSHVIYNGVDASLFASAPPYKHARRYVFAVGRLMSHKGFDVLVEAFAQFSEKFPAVDLLIAGDGPDIENLRRVVERMNLDGHVFWLGKVSSEQVASLMQGSDFIVIPSRREPFGIVALEALATGRPIIVSRVGGLVEAVCDAQVNWVEPGNVQALATAMIALGGANLDRSISANKTYALGFSWETMAARYSELFQ